MTLEIHPFGQSDEDKLEIRKKSKYHPYAAQVHGELEVNEKIVSSIPGGMDPYIFSTGLRSALQREFEQRVEISIATETDSNKKFLIITKVERPAEDQ